MGVRETIRGAPRVQLWEPWVLQNTGANARCRQRANASVFSSTQGAQSRTLGAFALVAALLVALSPAHAEEPSSSSDRITVLLDDGGRISMQCQILDYLGDRLSVRVSSGAAGGSLRNYTSSQVVDIQTPQTARHQKGLEQFDAGDVAAATKSFDDALEIESRGWVRRELLAHLVRCTLRQGDYAAAGTRFLALARSDPETRHFRLAPLVWGPYEISDERRAAARQWKSQPTEAAKLLAASVLLADEKLGAEAQTEMKSLARSANPYIHSLAEAQLWRLRLAQGSVLDDEIRRWEARIASMPEPVRGGPQYVVGLAYRQLRSHGAAAAAFLWLPVVYADDTHLAARACVEAGHELVSAGQKAEAANLYREALRRFLETPSAREAAKALDALP